MKKYFVLKNWDTGQYFTDYLDRWWSRDLGQAFLFDSEEEIRSRINNSSYEDVFEHVTFLVVETLYKNN